MSKGLAMICIVLGHYFIGFYPILRRIIYPFHVPVFFLVSGFLLRKTDFCQPLGAFTRKKAKALLFPYAGSCVFMIMVFVIQTVLWGEFKSISLNVCQLLCSSIYGGGVKSARYPLGYKYNWIGVLWFLPALFEALVLTYSIIHFIKKRTAQVICVLLVMAIGMLAVKYIPYQVPFALPSGMTAIIYVYTGYLISNGNAENISNTKTVIAGSMGIVGWYVAVRYDLLPSCAQARYGNSIGAIFLTVSCSVLASVTVMIIMKYYSYLLKRPGFLEYIGRNSLTVMCIHAIELRSIDWSRIFNGLSVKLGMSMTFKEQMVFRIVFIGVITIIAVNIIDYIGRSREG